MAVLNTVSLIGRITKDPSKKILPSGMVICDFSLALNSTYKDSSGVTQKETTFVDITTFGKLADVCNTWLKKGRLTFVGGRLKQDSWVDKTTNQNRSKLKVTGTNVQFLEYGERIPLAQSGQTETQSTPAADFVKNADKVGDLNLKPIADDLDPPF